MKIEVWLRLTKTPDPEFADRIGVSRQALWRYKAGERIPRPMVLKRIREATEGAVTADDFHTEAAPEAFPSTEAMT